jgi:hypothetical protein
MHARALSSSGAGDKRHQAAANAGLVAERRDQRPQHHLAMRWMRREEDLMNAAKKKRTPNKLFAVRLEKTHGKDLVCRAFLL